MKNSVLLVCFLMVWNFSLHAQELNCKVVVDAEQVGQSNRQIFETLQKSITDFINKTKWTNRMYAMQERINCSMYITVSNYESDRFSASIQVQSSRPVYNASYESPVFNFQDRQFDFRYLEFQPLFFNRNTFESNLVSVITYYVYVILGMDADTFAPEGGTDYYQQARNIVNLAQSSNYSGWKQSDGNKSRWGLVDNLLSNPFKSYRTALYEYHRMGLDRMAEDAASGKESMARSMKFLERVNSTRPNSFLLQVFFDAKKDEILNIFSDGPKVDIVSLKNSLNKVAPVYAGSWEKITF
ncbi:type IX secretion system protein PorD [Sinomicrobium sp. M5D2P17]